MPEMIEKKEFISTIRIPSATTSCGVLDRQHHSHSTMAKLVSESVVRVKEQSAKLTQSRPYI
jgi:hypothetical protein